MKDRYQVIVAGGGGGGGAGGEDHIIGLKKNLPFLGIPGFFVICAALCRGNMPIKRRIGRLTSRGKAFPLLDLNLFFATMIQIRCRLDAIYLAMAPYLLFIITIRHYIVNLYLSTKF